MMIHSITCRIAFFLKIWFLLFWQDRDKSGDRRDELFLAYPSSSFWHRCIQLAKLVAGTEKRVCVFPEIMPGYFYFRRSCVLGTH
jgi:hypothetical protein